MQPGLCFAQGIVNTADLDQFHLGVAVFFNDNYGPGVEDFLAAALAFTIMLFHVTQPGALADNEIMYTIVLGVTFTRVVDAAAGNDSYISSFADVERVINHIVQPLGCQYDRYVYCLPLGARPDYDIYSGLVQLCPDLD